MYLTLLNESLSAGEPKRNGVVFFNRTKNSVFEGTIQLATCTSTLVRGAKQGGGGGGVATPPEFWKGG